MRKITLLLCLLLLFSLPAASQVDPWAPVDEMGEIFGAYSYMSSDIGMHGFNISGAYRPAPWLGLVAELSGHYGSDQVLLIDIDSNVHNFLFGPRIYFDLPDAPRWRPFGHILFGASRVSTESEAAAVSESDTSFAWALGGGLDYALTENLAGRVVQADYIRTRWFDTGQNNYRLSFGLVYRFGR